MKLAARLLLTSALVSAPVAIAATAYAAEPVRIGVVSVLSGPTADRGQSEQYGIELAIGRINQAGGVLGRPIEVFYRDHADNPEAGIRLTRNLIEQQHVSAMIGALATPVTHAIMPVVKEAKVPLVVEISAGQDFVDASGVGGNDYVFKTIPSDLDIARDLMDWLKKQGVHSIAVVADDNGFSHANAESMLKAAAADGLSVVDNATVPKGTTDLSPLIDHLKTLSPDRVVTLLAPSTTAFFQAYEKSGWTTPISGRVDLAAAIKAVSAGYLAAGGLDKVTSVVNFSAMSDQPGVREFVGAYNARYGLMPTQRAFYAYEAANLVVDAIRRAGSDKPADIEAALKTSNMASLLGGTYRMDDHNHPHTPMQIMGIKDGKPAVIATVGS